MRLIAKILGVVLLCLAGAQTQAAHTQARLLLAAETAKPGDTVVVGIQLRMDAGWHTYWKNSGDSGMPTAIKWQLPAGVTAAPALYFLGLTWQHTRGSALLGWVGEDAKYVAERIEDFRMSQRPSETGEVAHVR